MPKVSEQVLIPHTADNLYHLVRDIRRYPEFIKWINAIEVSDETPEDADLYSCLGLASVTFQGFNERFTTQVEANPATRQINVRLVQGPFRHLRSRWQFDPREDGRTRVHCFIDYEFKNPVLRLVARANSRLAAELIIDAFRTEADRRFERVPR